MQRFIRVRDTVPDGRLLRILKKERKGRRNKFPLEAMWNALLAGVVFRHKSGESLREELRRNGELREECGFDPLRREEAVPPDYVWSRLYTKLFKHMELVLEILHALAEILRKELPDFGESTAIDGKAIPTYGRKDPDADWGKKVKVATGKDGRTYEKEVKWYGYKLHLLVDTRYELPMGFTLTKASAAEITQLKPLLEALEKTHPKLYARIRKLLADRGYDDTETKKDLYDNEGIDPLIDTRNMHKTMQPLDPTQSDTVYYSGTGQVCCKVDPFHADPAHQFVPMYHMGFEKDRMALKFRCPAKVWGIECKNRPACRCAPWVHDGDFGRVVRVPLETDRRLFFPTYRHSRQFAKRYKRRTSVERVNSRIDRVYNFEDHFLRGKKHMELRLTLSMIVMLGTAVAWVKLGKTQNVRSLLRAA